MSPRKVAALFVDPKGSYAGLEGVDLWDEKRDARNYQGSDPVVAHPPCSRWCRLAGLVQARWGYKIGDDAGCFASALESVRKFGGVLEHPAYSKAWDRYGLKRPPTGGQWVQADEYGWTCYVEQGQYGHPAKKATWLYAVRVRLPDLLWGHVADNKVTAYVLWCGNRVLEHGTRVRVGKKKASSTPPAFRDVLLEMARSART